MNQHPTDATLAAFGRRVLDAGSLIELDRHLADCAECRARLRTITTASATFAGLRRDISAAAVEHLSFEEVRALAEGRATVESARHASMCASCHAEVEDLRSAIGQTPPRRQWHWAAAAAVLLAVAAPIGWRALRSPAGSVVVNQLRDGGDLAPADANVVAETLRTGRLAVPQSILDLNRQRELLLGSSGGAARAFTLREPLGEAVIGRRPRFAWDALEGAASYRVRVYDENFRKVAEGPRVQATAWTPDGDLDAGHVYSWTVTADVAGQELRAPVPPAPEAKFAVPAAEALARMEEARRLHPDAHLLLATLYANAGAWRQARAELDELARANPQSEIVRGLETSLPPAR